MIEIPFRWRPRLGLVLLLVNLLVLVLPLFPLSLLLDVLFIAWGMGKLQQDMRWRLAQQLHPPLAPATSLTVPL